MLIPVGFIAELTGKVRLTTVAWAVDVAANRALRSYASVVKVRMRREEGNHSSSPESVGWFLPASAVAFVGCTHKKETPNPLNNVCNTYVHTYVIGWN